MHVGPQHPGAERLVPRRGQRVDLPTGARVQHHRDLVVHPYGIEVGHRAIPGGRHAHRGRPPWRHPNRDAGGEVDRRQHVVGVGDPDDVEPRTPLHIEHRRAPGLVHERPTPRAGDVPRARRRRYALGVRTRPPEADPHGVIPRTRRHRAPGGLGHLGARIGAGDGGVAQRRHRQIRGHRPARVPAPARGPERERPRVAAALVRRRLHHALDRDVVAVHLRERVHPRSVRGQRVPGHFRALVPPFGAQRPCVADRPATGHARADPGSGRLPQHLRVPDGLGHGEPRRDDIAPGVERTPARGRHQLHVVVTKQRDGAFAEHVGDVDAVDHLPIPPIRGRSWPGHQRRRQPEPLVQRQALRFRQPRPDLAARVDRPVRGMQHDLPRASERLAEPDRRDHGDVRVVERDPTHLDAVEPTLRDSECAHLRWDVVEAVRALVATRGQARGLARARQPDANARDRDARQIGHHADRGSFGPSDLRGHGDGDARPHDRRIAFDSAKARTDHRQWCALWLVLPVGWGNVEPVIRRAGRRDRSGDAQRRARTRTRLAATPQRTGAEDTGAP